MFISSSFLYDEIKVADLGRIFFLLNKFIKIDSICTYIFLFKLKLTFNLKQGRLATSSEAMTKYKHTVLRDYTEGEREKKKERERG